MISGAEAKKIAKILFEVKEALREGQYERCLQKIEQNLKNLSKDPGQLAAAYCLQADAYHCLIQDELAIIAYNKAIEINPYRDEYYSYQAKSYAQLHRYEEAIASYQQALKLNPHHEPYLLNLAGLYQMLGQEEAALDCYQQMLKLNPTNALIYRHIGLCCPKTSREPAFKEKLLELISQPSVLPETAIQGHFALGKIYLEEGKFHKAFAHLKEGNIHKAAQQPFDVPKYIQGIDELLEYYNETNLASQQQSSQWERPIFIVGLSRAGKTLLEQTIAQHTRVVQGGELSIIEKIIRMVTRRFGNAKFYPETANRFDAALKSEMREFFLHQLHHVNMDSSIHVVDTTPTNFKHLGLIGWLFPGAKIIHCRRHPLDHCLQIYFKYFGQGNAYAFDLKNIAYYYLQYQRLMEHWKKYSKLPILDIHYEDLITNTEHTLNLVFDYLKLSKPGDKIVNPNVLKHDEIGLWQEFVDYLDVCNKVFERAGVDVACYRAGTNSFKIN